MLHELCSKKLSGVLILQFSEQIEEPLIEASNVGVLVRCNACAGAKSSPMQLTPLQLREKNLQPSDIDLIWMEIRVAI